MILIAGVDPGTKGAIGVYDQEADKLVAVFPLPNYQIKVGTVTRTRLDLDDLCDLFDALAAMGVKFILIENVQGGNFRGKKQSAAGAFQFGYTFGLLTMAAKRSGIDYDTASPGVWKLVEKVPGEARGIIAKADAEFPEHTALWHGPKGGDLHDRADAAFLSRYASRRLWPARQHREGLRTLAAGLAKTTDVPGAPSPPVANKNPARGKRKAHANGVAKRT